MGIYSEIAKKNILEAYTKAGNEAAKRFAKEELKKALKKYSQLTGEERLCRWCMCPQDGSTWQTFKRFDKPKPILLYPDLDPDNTYLVSDLHFGKNKETDIKNIRLLQAIPHNATLIILGDLTYWKAKSKEYVKSIFKDLHFRKYLLLGNHDCLDLEYYYSLGILGVFDRLYAPGMNWVFSHQPCNGPKRNLLNFHGHIHGDRLTRIQSIEGTNGEQYFTYDLYTTDNHINVWEGYCPRKIRTIREWISWWSLHGDDLIEHD